MPKSYRVDFRAPIGESGKRKAKVFTFTLAENEEEAKANVLRHHKGSDIVKVEEQKR